MILVCSAHNCQLIWWNAQEFSSSIDSVDCNSEFVTLCSFLLLGCNFIPPQNNAETNTNAILIFVEISF